MIERHADEDFRAIKGAVSLKHPKPVNLTIPQIKDFRAIKGAVSLKRKWMAWSWSLENISAPSKARSH